MTSPTTRQLYLGLMLLGLLLMADSATPACAQAFGSWTYTGSLKEGRIGPLVTRLPDGRVLVFGGFRYDPVADDYVSVGSAELYEPATGTWSFTGSPHGVHSSATLLANGKVLAIADYSTEVYDPRTGTWTPTGNPYLVFSGHKEVLLQDGRVLMVGGYRAELYDPNTGIWSATGGARKARYNFTAAALPNGKVLIAGGSPWFDYPPHSLNSAELYDPATGSWNFTGNLNTGREYHATALLGNGKVVVIGGSVCADSSCSLPMKSTELYDPATGTWSYTGDLNTPRGAISALPLSDGNVFVMGGYTYDNTSGNPEVYNANTGLWSKVANPSRNRYGGALAALVSGKVLLAGGETCIDECSLDKTAELYSSAIATNQIDGTEFFVTQHYLDFLNRQPDASGLSFWANNITSCGFDPACFEVKRIDTSAAFFLSIEFQQTGYLVYRTYKASYGNLPNAPVPIKFNEFLPDTQQIGQGVIVNQAGWEQVLENNKQAFFSAFVQRARFTSAYPTSLTPEQFVDQLFANAAVTPGAAARQAAINEFNSAANTTDTAARARALRRIAENSTLAQQEFNRAFVLTQYFGYLRRNPNDPPEATLDFQGYNFWLNKLNQFNGNYGQAEMVKAFLVSAEYRQRFGQ